MRGRIMFFLLQMGGGPPHPLGPGGMPMGPGMPGMPHPGMIPGFPPGMGGPSANLQQMLALSGGGPGLHPAVSSSALALMNPGAGPPPDSGRQSELQHRASALSSNPGSSLYLDHDRRNSISPSSPPDVKENDVSGRSGNVGDRDRNSRGGAYHSAFYSCETAKYNWKGPLSFSSIQSSD